MNATSISAVTIQPNGDPATVELHAVDHSTLADLQAAVGGDVAAVALAGDLDMWVHEEGLLRGLEYNGAATALAHYFGATHQVYVGPAVFTGGVDEEGNTLGLSPERLAEVVELLKSY